jgi:hypothetical protein
MNGKSDLDRHQNGIKTTKLHRMLQIFNVRLTICANFIGFAAKSQIRNFDGDKSF